MIRSVAGAIAGLLIAFVLIQAVEMLGHTVYPPPNDVDLGNSEQVRTYVSTLPIGGILFIGAAWAAGAFFGTLSGALIAGREARPLIFAIVVGGLVQSLVLPAIGFSALYMRYRLTDKRLRPSKAWDAALILSCLSLLAVGLFSLTQVLTS